MENRAKIQLSALEAGLVNNAELILTKNNILKKVDYLFQELQVVQTIILQSCSPHLPSDVLIPNPKISKGENYRGLPYRVLDNPRYFNQQDVFAIRTFFWWGNYFSITLHLSGIYKKMILEKIIDSYQLLKDNEFSCCVNTNEWEHHFESDNYKTVAEMDKSEFEDCIRSKNFLKLAQKFSLDQWEHVPEILTLHFRKLLEITGINSPAGERVL